MDLIEFIKGYAERNDKYTTVYLEWIWNDDGVDEEYSFEGSASEFVEKYTEHYDCIDGFTLDNVAELKIENTGSYAVSTKIFIEIRRD